jgi:uncharacterized protein
VTLDELAEYLTSDDAPAGCMDLSELDGFLAGLLAGPDEVPVQEWLDEIWSEDAPAADERDAVEQAIRDRYEAIKAGLDGSVLAYEPILWVDGGGSVVSEDWAAGFMQAVSLRAAAWQPALADDDASALLIPIASLAGMTLDEDERTAGMLPDDALDSLMEDAVKVLPVCVLGLRRFWQGLESDRGPVRH